MKKFSMLLLSIFTTAAAAQNARLVTVVDAERAFARHARETSVRQAFLAYMDSASLIVDRDNKLVPGQPLYRAAPESPGYLRWMPEFAASSADGTFGFTTGPYDFRPNRNADTILSQGEYATVWRRSTAGEWKFVIDMGTPYQMPNQMPARQEILPPDVQQDKKPGKSLLEAEQAFARQFAKNRSRAYRTNLAASYRLLRLGRNPISPGTIDNAYFNQLPDLTFEVTGHTLAPSGDMGVVYGYVVPLKGDALTQKNAFLRVWRREGNKWKMVLEVLRI